MLNDGCYIYTQTHMWIHITHIQFYLPINRQCVRVSVFCCWRFFLLDFLATNSFLWSFLLLPDTDTDAVATARIMTVAAAAAAVTAIDIALFQLFHSIKSFGESEFWNFWLTFKDFAPAYLWVCVCVSEPCLDEFILMCFVFFGLLFFLFFFFAAVAVAVTSIIVIFCCCLLLFLFFFPSRTSAMRVLLLLLLLVCFDLILCFSHYALCIVAATLSYLKINLLTKTTIRLCIIIWIINVCANVINVRAKWRQAQVAA